MIKLSAIDTHGKPLKSKTFNKNLITIGSDPRSDLQVKTHDLEPFHISIKKTDSELIVMDLIGKTPMLVNATQTIEQSFKHRKGLIRLGELQLEVERLQNNIIDFNPSRIHSEKSTKNLVARVRFFRNKKLFYAQNTTHNLNLSEIILNSLNLSVEKNSSTFLKKTKQGFILNLPNSWDLNLVQIRFNNDNPVSATERSVLIQTEGTLELEYGIYSIVINVSKKLIDPKISLLEQEQNQLKKPLGISILLSLALLLLLILLPEKEPEKTPDPYELYARTKVDAGGGGGGGGNESETESATTKENQVAPAIEHSKNESQEKPSTHQLAKNTSQGVKNIIGSILAQTSVLPQMTSQSKSNTQKVSGVQGSITLAQSSGSGLGSLGQISNSNKGSGGSGGGNGGGKGTGSGIGIGSGVGKGTGSGMGGGIGSGIGTGVGSAKGPGIQSLEEELLIDGGLDRDVILAVIQSNLGQIKHCFERQLILNPELHGKVAMKWTIIANGSVEGTTVSQSTLNSMPVESCIASKIGNWKFPKPRNGVKVNVNYPFLFKTAK